MKKFIIGTLGVLFASAIAVAVWTSNVKANDLLACNVAALSMESTIKCVDSEGWTTGGCEYKRYKVVCQQIDWEPASYAENKDSYSNEEYGNANIKIVEYGGHAKESDEHFSSQTSSEHVTEHATYHRVVCGNGFGLCIFPDTPSGGNPCI